MKSLLSLHVVLNISQFSYKIGPLLLPIANVCGLYNFSSRKVLWNWMTMWIGLCPLFAPKWQERLRLGRVAGVRFISFSQRGDPIDVWQYCFQVTSVWHKILFLWFINFHIIYFYCNANCWQWVLSAAPLKDYIRYGENEGMATMIVLDMGKKKSMIIFYNWKIDINVSEKKEKDSF